MNGVDARIGDRIIKMRDFIDQRFRDILLPGRDDDKLRAHAHDALNYFLAGNPIAGEEYIRKLDLKGAVDFRRKLGELDLLPKKEFKAAQ